MNWIKFDIRDRSTYPHYNQDVLVYQPKDKDCNYRIGYLDKCASLGLYFVSQADDYILDGVTHWSTLTKPGENDNEQFRFKT